MKRVIGTLLLFIFSLSSFASSGELLSYILQFELKVSETTEAKYQGRYVLKPTLTRGKDEIYLSGERMLKTKTGAGQYKWIQVLPRPIDEFDFDLVLTNEGAWRRHDSGDPRAWMFLKVTTIIPALYENLVRGYTLKTAEALKANFDFRNKKRIVFKGEDFELIVSLIPYQRVPTDPHEYETLSRRLDDELANRHYHGGLVEDYWRPILFKEVIK